MAARHLTLGRAGEDAATAFLKRKGYAILARNWVSGKLEIDLVCRDRDTLVFVEVKTRGAGSMGLPAHGLTMAKQRNLVRAASLYLSQNRLWESPCRFDLVAVSDRDGIREVEHVENAFDAGPWAGSMVQPW